MTQWRFVFLSELMQHAPMLADWHVREWQSLVPDMNVPDMLAEFETHTGQLQVPTTLLALDGARVAGSVSLLENDHDDIRAYSPWLASLFVTPEDRGRGLGIELVRRCEDMAHRRGITRLYLYTSGQEPFYRKLGWDGIATLSLRGACASVMAVAPRALDAPR